jgi:hypothetical protein
MLPNKTCDTTECLNSLVGVKAECGNENCFPYYIEDVEGIDLETLASIAPSNALSGNQFGKDIIAAAAREMKGDMQMMIANGFSLTPTFGEVSSTCDFSSVIFQPGGGVKVLNSISSGYGVLHIPYLEIAANYTGDAVLVLDDGKAPKTFNVSLTAGEIIPCTLAYSTTQKIVKVSLSNSGIALSQINCNVVSSCGCGGSQNKESVMSVRYSGLLNGMDGDIQYGFKVTAFVSCSQEILTCELTRTVPDMLGMALLYKVGQKVYSETALSTRMNRVAGQDSEEDVTMRDYYEKLYRERMYGTTKVRGIRDTIANYLATKSKDKCMQCNSKTTRTGWATG